MTTQVLTGHQVHKVANELLKEYGQDTIPPQMVYNYIKGGRIAIVWASSGEPCTYEEAKGTGDYGVLASETVRWVKEFVQNRRTGSNTQSDIVTDLLREIRGDEVVEMEDEEELDEEVE